MHHHSFEHFSALLAFLSKRYSFMDSQQSLCVLPSNAPALSSGDLGFSNLVSKSTSRTRLRISSTVGCTQNHAASTISQNQERKRRRQNVTVAKAELRSEKYVAYRRKQHSGEKKAQTEPKWDDEVEEVFQLGMLENTNVCICLSYTALREIPKTYRRLTPCSVANCGRTGTKLCGRNEHIEHFIELRTGVRRGRKQISSHLQVLKNMQKDNNECMISIMNKLGDG